MRFRVATTYACLALLAGPVAAQQTLTVGVGGAFTSMDPHYHNLGPNNVLTTYVFDPLVRFDPKFNPEPSLAVSWRAIGETTWEFKLREGVTFHDGTPFTADDVVFTYERVPRVLNSPSSFTHATKAITRMEVVDAHTIRLHTANPVPLLANNLAGVRIVSRKHGEGATTGSYNTHFSSSSFSTTTNVLDAVRSTSIIPSYSAASFSTSTTKFFISSSIFSIYIGIFSFTTRISTSSLFFSTSVTKKISKYL